MLRLHVFGSCLLLFLLFAEGEARLICNVYRDEHPLTVIVNGMSTSPIPYKGCEEYEVPTDTAVNLTVTSMHGVFTDVSFEFSSSGAPVPFLIVEANMTRRYFEWTSGTIATLPIADTSCYAAFGAAIGGVLANSSQPYLFFNRPWAGTESDGVGFARSTTGINKKFFAFHTISGIGYRMTWIKGSFGDAELFGSTVPLHTTAAPVFNGHVHTLALLGDGGDSYPYEWMWFPDDLPAPMMFTAEVCNFVPSAGPVPVTFRYGWIPQSFNDTVVMLSYKECAMVDLIHGDYIQVLVDGEVHGFFTASAEDGESLLVLLTVHYRTRYQEIPPILLISHTVPDPGTSLFYKAHAANTTLQLRFKDTGRSFYPYGTDSLVGDDAPYFETKLESLDTHEPDIAIYWSYSFFFPNASTQVATFSVLHPEARAFLQGKNLFFFFVGDGSPEYPWEVIIHPPVPPHTPSSSTGGPSTEGSSTGGTPSTGSAPTGDESEVNASVGNVLLPCYGLVPVAAALAGLAMF